MRLAFSSVIRGGRVALAVCGTQQRQHGRGRRMPGAPGRRRTA